MSKKKKPSTQLLSATGAGGEKEAVMQQPCHRACGPEKQAVSIEIHRGRDGSGQCRQQSVCTVGQKEHGTGVSHIPRGGKGRRRGYKQHRIEISCNPEKKKKKIPSPRTR